MDSRVAGYTARNRDAWNEIARSRRSLLATPDFFASGGSTLDPEETAALGSVRGRRLLNLQCASGNDALSWAVLGARVVGVDISEVAIQIAREQASAAGLDAEFLVADVYDLPARLQDESFDITYSSAGITCWLPDLDAWAETIRRSLRPGGTFLLDEHHPAWETVVVDDDGIRVTLDYFGRARPHAERADPGKQVSGTPVQPDFVNFTWPLGDVVTALAAAGLRIRRVEERPDPAMYLKGPVDPTPQARLAASRLPAAYLLVATKEGAEQVGAEVGPRRLPDELL